AGLARARPRAGGGARHSGPARPGRRHAHAVSRRHAGCLVPSGSARALPRPPAAARRERAHHEAGRARARGRAADVAPLHAHEEGAHPHEPLVRGLGNAVHRGSARAPGRRIGPRGGSDLRRLDGAGPRLSRAPRGAEARARVEAPARAARPGVVEVLLGAPARGAPRPALGAPHLSRDRDGRQAQMSRHLLAINFRDPAHPEAGGAELHLEHVLLEAVRRGWRVTWLAAAFPGGAPESEHRGMRVIRRGEWWNFNLVVPGVLGREFGRGRAPDLVVEDVNKVPCMAPWHTRAPVAVVVPHLFGTTAFREANPAVASYVIGLEALIPFAYARCRFVAISESTRDDLIARGLEPSRISVVHCGVDHERYRRDPGVLKA